MRPLLGTFVVVRVNSVSHLTQAQLESAIQSSFRAVEQVEHRMSFHRKRSDIGRLNRGRPGTILRVHRWTYAVLSKAMQLWRVSDGAFDCNIGMHLVRAGLLPGRILKRLHQNTAKTDPAITLRPGGKIRLNRSVSLDLGGIAKGFAVDKAVEVLKAHGVVSGMVNAGGDLRVFGHSAQPIWIRHFDPNNGYQLVGELCNGAIATSASYFTRHMSTDGVEASPIVDAALARRVEMKQSISVIAPTCMQADALTKIVALRGRLPRSLARVASAHVLKV